VTPAAWPRACAQAEKEEADASKRCSKAEFVSDAPPRPALRIITIIIIVIILIIVNSRRPPHHQGVF
jgi:hypothetical protein